MINPLAQPICLFGAGGHGRVVESQMRRAGFENICFGDTFSEVGQILGASLVEYSTLDSLPAYNVLVTIGDNNIRRKLQTQAEQLALNIITFIASPDRYYSKNGAGPGSVILQGAIVNCDARIGQGVIVNSSVVVEHDVEIGNFSHISPGVILAGGCKVGANCWIGANATVINSISIAPNVTIGAGSVVLKDIKEPGVYVGCPARRVK